MEGLLFFLVIVALQVGATWIKKRAEQKSRPVPPPEQEYDDESEYGNDEDDFPDEDDMEPEEDLPPTPPDPLQELIRKFREEQAKQNGEILPEPESPKVLTEQESIPEEIPAVSPQATETPPLQNRFQEAARIYTSSDVPEASDEISRAEIADTDYSREQTPEPKFAFSIREARKGFLWANVLNDPRFKRPFAGFRFR